MEKDIKKINNFILQSKREVQEKILDEILAKIETAIKNGEDSLEISVNSEGKNSYKYYTYIYDNANFIINELEKLGFRAIISSDTYYTEGRLGIYWGNNKASKAKRQIIDNNEMNFLFGGLLFIITIFFILAINQKL